MYDEISNDSLKHYILMWYFMHYTELWQNQL